jgi:hypothetical protein
MTATSTLPVRSSSIASGGCVSVRLSCSPGCRAASRGHRRRHERSDRRGEAGEAHPAGGQADVSGQLGAGGVDAPDDLRRALRQQLPGRREPDPAAHPLQQLRAGLGLEPREVMGDRRLGVVQLLRCRRDRSVTRDGVDDAQPVDIQDGIDSIYEFP